MEQQENNTDKDIVSRMEEFTSTLAKQRILALMEPPMQEMPVSLPNSRIQELINEVSSVLGCRKDF